MKIYSTKTILRKQLIAFSIFFVLVSTGIFTWIKLKNQLEDNGMKTSLRKVSETNEKLFSKIFSNNNLVKTYPASMAVKNVRVNGDVGMGDDFDAEGWQLNVLLNDEDTLILKLDDIKKLPKTEITFDFKCIEGWSQVTNWGGVKFADFVKYYHLDSLTTKHYVGMSTPDDEYYVGIDMPSVMHPQTLLCYEMNGKPLPVNQGFPLRLIIPVKYGIKHIKRIGTMYFSNEKPPDYWAERGYDYYSGL